MSRTTISKWESGRGYPSIDSLKEISNFFSVSIDELLSGEKLLFIAEKENKSNIQRIYSLLFGIVDLFSFMLIVLPLYPKHIGEKIYSVNLFSYTEITWFIKSVYWIMFLLLILSGVAKILITQLTQFKIERCQTVVTIISLVLSILTVLLLAMTREAYAISVAFVLLVVKATLLLKCTKSA